MDYKITRKTKYIDERGHLTEFLTRSELKNGEVFGHIYFVTFEKPGVIRGNHFHHKNEYFGIAYGRLRFLIQDIKTKETKQFILDADDKYFIRIKIGPNIAHAVESLSEKAILIDYFPEPYNAQNPDNHRAIIIEQTLVELD